MADFVMRGFHAGGGWNQDFRDNLDGPQVVFTLVFVLRDHIKLFKRKLALSLWPFQPDPSAIGDQNRNDRRGTDKLGRPFIAENGMVAVFTVCNQLLARLVLRQQAKPV